MQVMRFCNLPLYFAGLPDFVLSCDEEEGGNVDFTARLGEADSWEYVRSRIHLHSGQIRFFVGELDVDEDYENYLNAKIDRRTQLQISDLEHEVILNNRSSFKTGADVVNDWSLAKVFNSDWVKDSELQNERHFDNRNYKDRRVIHREHLVLLSKQCYVEFIATDAWKIDIGYSAALGEQDGATG